MNKDSKNKIKPRLPRGLADRGPGELAATRAMLEKIRAVFERYGFEAVETPAIEYTEALGKFLPDQDRPNEGVFSFQDDDEQWLSLRYDLTAPLARYVAENYQNLALPYRSYREGWVFRNEKPGPGRYRQFMQFDADTVGSASPAADAEMCMMAADTMEALGIKRGDYVVKVNNRKVLDGVMEAIGIGGEENAGKRLTVLRAIDKLDRLGVDSVRMLLGPGRKDESGDFAKGAGLVADQIDPLLDFLSPIFPLDHLVTKDGKIIQEDSEAADRISADQIVEKRGSNLSTISWLRGVFDNAKYQEGLLELEQVAKLANESGYTQSQICIDSSVVRGLEYYTGPVYEVDLTFEIKDEKGRPVRFGSVGAGGRYDRLVARFRGEPVPATGFSVGVSRLLAALQAIKSPIVAGGMQAGPVVVTVFERDRIADYQRMAQTLRAANIRAEMYLGNPKNNLGAQLKYADKRGAPCAIIQGGDEKARGEVLIKDLAAGAALAGQSTERDDYLKKQAQAQVPVKEEDLVVEVKKLLDRHGIKH
ncbi:MAG: histidine--tRNA ligase [Xanthobacteraceae bacterium]